MSGENSAERWSRLDEMILRLAKVRTLEDAIPVLRSAARFVAAADGITVVRREADTVHYVAEDAVSPLWTGQRFPIESCISGIAILMKKPVIIPDIYADPRVPHYAYQQTFVESMAMFPLGFGEPVAALGAYWSRRGEISPVTISLLATTARSISAALERAEANYSLRCSNRTVRPERSRGT